MTNELKPLEEIRCLIQEAYNILHACNREMLTREVRDDTKAVLYRALKIIDTRPAGMVLVEKPYRIVDHGRMSWPGRKPQYGLMLRYKDQNVHKAMLKALQGKDG